MPQLDLGQILDDQGNGSEQEANGKNLGEPVGNGRHSSPRGEVRHDGTADNDRDGTEWVGGAASDGLAGDLPSDQRGVHCPTKRLGIKGGISKELAFDLGEKFA